MTRVYVKIGGEVRFDREVGVASGFAPPLELKRSVAVSSAPAPQPKQQPEPMTTLTFGQGSTMSGFCRRHRLIRGY